MKEHPILFSTEMVKAILENRKTMTRRVVKPQPVELIGGGYFNWHPATDKIGTQSAQEMSKLCPYGQVGDRLWVRETWASDCTCDNPKCNGVIYKAGYDGKIIPDKWRPSIFMPRWASRITLEITNIRAERLQDITHGDAIREGIRTLIDQIISFCYLWDSINAKRGYSWESNPRVWVIEFKKV